MGSRWKFQEREWITMTALSDADLSEKYDGAKRSFQLAEWAFFGRPWRNLIAYD